MYCYQCGVQLSDEAKFCSGCGRTIDSAQPVRRQPQRDMGTHVNILAWLFIGNAVLCALFAFTLFIAPKFLQMMPLPVPPEAPFDVLQFVTAISGVLGMVFLVMAGGSATAGVGLLQYQPWGRILALVMAAVMILKIPFGTALGIYAFWVLLSERGRLHYEQKSALVEGRA